MAQSDGKDPDSAWVPVSVCRTEVQAYTLTLKTDLNPMPCSPTLSIESFFVLLLTSHCIIQIKSEHVVTN